MADSVILNTQESIESAVPTNNLRRSKRIPQIQTAQNNASNHVSQAKPRVPRTIDPIQRRNKAWPFKWETWRLNAMAAQFQRSAPEAVERLRAAQDELWKTNAQDASFYEDVLELYDEQNVARADNGDETDPLEVENRVRETMDAVFLGVEGPIRETIETPNLMGAPDHNFEDASSQNGDLAERPVSADNEAALALLALRYSGPAQDYHQDTEHDNSVRLRAFDSQIITATSPKDLPRTTRTLRSMTHASLIGRGQRSTEHSTAPSQSPRRLRSKVNPPSSTTSVGKRTLRSSTKPLADAINLSSKFKDEIKSSDRSRAFDRFVDFSSPSSDIVNLATPAIPISKSPMKKPFAPRRSKRKAAIVVSEDMASPTPKKLKLAEQSDTDSPTPIRRKGRQILHEEHEDDEEVNASIHNSPVTVKAKPSTKKPQRRLNNAPAELPLKAPANAPGIPSDALAIGEFFEKNKPCALGVQLPTNKTRTQWEWTPYITRKAGNAHFDWADEKHVKDANRWRQQRIRRRFAEHGLVDDGRKRR